jgi:hypothetical protein
MTTIGSYSWMAIFSATKELAHKIIAMTNATTGRRFGFFI